MSIVDELCELSFKHGGSHGTRSARKRSVKRFADYLRRGDVGIRHVKHVRLKHIQGFGADLQAFVQSGLLNVRSAQNIMAHVRGVLRQVGKWKIVKDPAASNAALGLAGGCRLGKRRAILDEEFRSYFPSLRERNESSAWVAAIQRALGLRALEAVRAGQIDVLNRIWRDVNNGRPAYIIEGTKGGRPRFVTVHNVQIIKKIIMWGLRILARSGAKFIIRGAGGHLKSALDKYLRDLRAIGMKGDVSSHSLRYAWAQESMRLHIQRTGVSFREALILVSLDLGHGDRRGRFIRQVYGREGIGYRLSLPSAIFGLLDDEFGSP